MRRSIFCPSTFPFQYVWIQEYWDLISSVPGCQGGWEEGKRSNNRVLSIYLAKSPEEFLQLSQTYMGCELQPVCIIKTRVSALTQHYWLFPFVQEGKTSSGDKNVCSCNELVFSLSPRNYYHSKSYFRFGMDFILKLPVLSLNSL